MSIVLDRNLVSDHDRIVVAVSGGIDSMVLLDLLVSLRERRKLELIVAHVDHQKRRASPEDARFVEARCASDGIPFMTMRLDPTGAGNFHDRARKARYAFFREVAHHFGATKIALAHQADDQAETILMRLVRGAGLAGYAGIPERSRYDGIELIRPLLHVSRAEIAAYQAEHDIPFRVDESNAEDHYTRNRFRHRLMPQIAQENPRYLQKFAQFAAYVDEAHAVVRRLAEEFAASSLQAEPNRVGFPAAAFRALETAVRKEVVKLAFDRLTGDALELSHAQMLSAIAIIVSDKPRGAYDLPGGFRIEKNYDAVAFVRAIDAHPPFSIPIPGFGRYGTPGGSILSVQAKPDDIDGFRIELCYNNLDFIFPMTLRTRKNGDRIAFAYGTKKLKDLFIDRKLPMDERNRMALLIGKTGEVLWIPGLNIKASTPTGRETIYITYTRG